MADPTGLTGRLGRYGRLGWSFAGLVIGAALLVIAGGILLPLLLPLLVMALVGATLQPAVDGLRRRGVPAGVAALAGAIAVPLALLALAVLFGVAVVGEASKWLPTAEHAGARLHQLLGADPVQALRQWPGWRTALTGLGSAFATGAVVAGQVAVGILIGGYLLFYAFRDGPRCFEVLEARLPQRRPGLMRELAGSAAYQFRRYMLGTTFIALMDAAVITLGALLLGLPLIGTIAMVTFAAAYVPYLGAWISAAFAVLLALGAGGVQTAVWMLLIVLITQNILEGILRPAVFGRALGLHPVAVLGVTILGAAVGGLFGVFLAPPITAIAVSW
ncbi:AI-2E family transporter, partial [Dactylosporangium sp. NPDC051484]|uniref:AI-2E family transporter n=1 Tax=Dactylosporangium sp. NPDC051484 TaxID=3154942 RepID=UPI003450B9CE